MSVSRVVLDTCYLRGISDGHLNGLRDRGFTVALPLSAVQELWAQSLAESKPGLLFGRLNRLSPFVDPEFPIVPGGQQLMDILAGPSKPLRAQARNRWRAQAAPLWHLVTTSVVSPDRWAEVGRLAEREIAEFADAIKNLRSPGRARQELTDFNNITDSEAVRQLRPRLSRGLGVGALPERLDAFYSVMVRGIVADGRGRITHEDNDAEDDGMLMHVAWPAVLLTNDQALLEKVDASGSSQAPWVRSAGDLLRNGVPPGVPWGPSAKKASSRFRRPDREERRRLERLTAGPAVSA